MSTGALRELHPPVDMRPSPSFDSAQDGRGRIFILEGEQSSCALGFVDIVATGGAVSRPAPTRKTISLLKCQHSLEQIPLGFRGDPLGLRVPYGEQESALLASAGIVCIEQLEPTWHK